MQKIVHRKSFLGNNFLVMAGCSQFSWIRHDISSRSYYYWPAQFCARKSFPMGQQGETRADYLIMLDAVYSAFKKKTGRKRPGSQRSCDLPDLYCDAPRRTAENDAALQKLSD